MVNFYGNSRKSENLHFDGLLLSIAYKVSAKKIQKSYLSWHWRVIQTLKKIELSVWKMTWGIWWILTRAVETLKICTLMGNFCWKYGMFELKKNIELRNDLWFQKWHKEFGEQVVESKVDKSSVYNVLTEGMYYLNKSSPSNFNFSDFPLLVWSCPNSSCDFWNQNQFLYKFCTIL